MHTKDKGSVAEAIVISDLTRKGYRIALPIGENVPFDLIAIRPDYGLVKIQIKYRKLSPNGTVSVKLSSTWKNSAITRVVRYNLDVIDYFAVYCPEANAVAYVPSAELKKHKVFALRINPSRNNQASHVRAFETYSTF
ncbi:MAG: hypothetical protein HY741_11100 [Chloroflexi bacterium]|nr:hypothetical protein [Chloroflexota bacterium]